MYGLDESIDLGFLFNRKVEQICVGLYDVQVNINGGISIAIYGNYEHVLSNNVLTSKDDMLPEAASSLLKLLGQKIVGEKRDGSKVLKLEFSNDSTLIIYDDDERYESYTIDGPDVSIIV